MLLGHPMTWLHQQLSVELAISCSEWSASLLAKQPPEDELRCPRVNIFGFKWLNWL